MELKIKLPPVVSWESSLEAGQGEGGQTTALAPRKRNCDVHERHVSQTHQEHIALEMTQDGHCWGLHDLYHHSTPPPCHRRDRHEGGGGFRPPRQGGVLALVHRHLAVPSGG
jgi:hypothetical protein